MGRSFENNETGRSRAAKVTARTGLRYVPASRFPHELHYRHPHAPHSCAARAQQPLRSSRTSLVYAARLLLTAHFKAMCPSREGIPAALRARSPARMDAEPSGGDAAATQLEELHDVRAPLLLKPRLRMRRAAPLACRGCALTRRSLRAALRSARATVSWRRCPRCGLLARRPTRRTSRGAPRCFSRRPTATPQSCSSCSRTARCVH